MSFKMILKMTSKNNKIKLYTEKDLNYERIFEVRVVDIRGRSGIKQKSFSVLVDKGLKNNEYPTTEEFKQFLENKVTEFNDIQK